MIIDSASKENMDKDLDAVGDDKEDIEEHYLDGDAEWCKNAVFVSSP